MKSELKAYEERMRKSVASVAADFAAVRAGRANAAVLDRIMVDYYGTPTPIHQIASIGSPDPRTLTIQPWDKGGIAVVEKAILLFRDQGKSGERVADTIQRIGFEQAQELLLEDELLKRKEEILGLNVVGGATC